MYFYVFSEKVLYILIIQSRLVNDGMLETFIRNTIRYLFMIRRLTNVYTKTTCEFLIQMQVKIYVQGLLKT